MTERPEIRVTVEVELDGAEALTYKRAELIVHAIRPGLAAAFPDVKIRGLWVHSVEWNTGSLRRADK